MTEVSRSSVPRRHGARRRAARAHRRHRGGAFWALGLQYHLPVALFNEQYLGLFLGLGLAGVFIVVKAHPAAPHDRVPWYDWAAAAAALGVGLYITILYPSLSYSLASLSWDRLVRRRSRSR